MRSQDLDSLMMMALGIGGAIVLYFGTINKTEKSQNKNKIEHVQNDSTTQIYGIYGAPLLELPVTKNVEEESQSDKEMIEDLVLPKNNVPPYVIKREYVFSEEIDNYFTQRGIPLDSILAYPQETISGLKKTKADVERLALIYRRGLHPGVAKEFNHKFIHILDFCSQRNIGSKFYNTIPQLYAKGTEYDNLVNDKGMTSKQFFNEFKIYEKLYNEKKLPLEQNTADFMRVIKEMKSISEYEHYFDLNTPENRMMNFTTAKKIKDEGVSAKELKKEYDVFIKIINSGAVSKGDYNQTQFLTILEKVDYKISDLEKFVMLNKKYQVSITFEDAKYFRDTKLSLERVEKRAINIHQEYLDKKIDEHLKK